METNEIKALLPTTCPNCKTPMLIELASSAPRLISILTAESIEEAKKQAAKEIAVLSIDSTTKKEVLDWIKDEKTIFSPSDIPQIIENLKTPKDN